MLHKAVARALGKLASSPELLLDLVEQAQRPLGCAVRLRAHTQLRRLARATIVGILIEKQHFLGRVCVRAHVSAVTHVKIDHLPSRLTGGDTGHAMGRSTELHTVLRGHI
mgnify:CR=1 FL=1